MGLATVILIFMGLLLAAMLLEPLSRRIHLPFPLVLVAVGFFGSEWLVAKGVDTGLRWYHFHDLVFYLILPVLVFEAAFRMDMRQLLRNLIMVLVFAVPVTVLATVITAVVIYIGIGDGAGFPWLTALIAGALLSATDPVGVLDLFKNFSGPSRVALLLEAESLFNDATTIVLFTLLIAVVSDQAASISWQSGVVQFGKLFLGGALAGVITGLIAALLIRWFADSMHATMVTIMAAYVSFLVAEILLHLSGVMGALACGMVLGVWHRSSQRNQDGLVENVWSMGAWIANSYTFLLLGITVTTAMFTKAWLAMLIGICAVLLARAIGIYGVGTLISWLPGTAPITPVQRTIMFWGGLRGAVTAALALSLPVELEGWWIVQSIAYGVVLFSLVVQLPTIKPLLLRTQRTD